tara:strand:+ start:169 stop:720 length:552 start_codon:yes stop_codon:yes gene_type:complete
MNREQIRKLIIQELKRTIGEDAIITDPEGKDPHVRGDFSTYDSFNEELCEQCGGMTYEGQCMEASCGGMSKQSKMLEEGGCGCEESSSNDGTDYSTDTMGMIGDALSSLTHAGYDGDAAKEDHRSHNNYMAKPSLYKVAKYAQKLLHMIPDGYELDDWQRTKIAQLADDISEVYHSLDYDFRD